MFGGRKGFSAREVETYLKGRGLAVAAEAPSNPNDLVRFAYRDRDVPFWLTLSAYKDRPDGLTFFTAVPASASMDSINAFNSKYKFSKAYIEGGSVCCTLSLIAEPDAFDQMFLQKSFALWELALPAFGEMILEAS